MESELKENCFIGTKLLTLKLIQRFKNAQNVMKSFYPRSWILTTVAVISGSAIINKIARFRDVIPRKRFVGSLHFSFTGCCITSFFTYCLKCTRVLDISERYHITSLLLAVATSVKYRYELYCNQNDVPDSQVFWKSQYPWVMYCAAPSLFLCGYNKDVHWFALQNTITAGLLGVSIGVLLPNDGFLKDFGTIFSGVGLGIIVSKLFLIFCCNKSLFSFHPYIDSFYLGLVLLIFGFIVEDVRALKEKANSAEDEDCFDELSTSTPVYVDCILLFLFMSQLIEPFVTLHQMSL